MMSASVSGLNCLGVNSNVGSLIQRLEKEQEDREQNREQKEPKDKEVDKETFIKEVKEKAEQIKKEQKEVREGFDQRGTVCDVYCPLFSSSVCFLPLWIPQRPAVMMSERRSLLSMNRSSR